MNRIQSLFTNKKSGILSVYFTAGYPNLNDTVPTLEAFEKHGVDMVELGIPYSDPLADGPTIQESSTIAIRNGMRIEVLLNQLKDVRQKVSIPIVLMSYFNPTYLYGFERFCKQASEAGVDGLIIPDLPAYEYETTYKSVVEKYNLSFNMLITSDTPDERIRKIDELTNGFIYMVSSAATTGGTSSMSDAQMDYFKRVSEMKLNNPLMVGFGVHNQQTFNEATTFCNGAIIGSAFIRAQKNGDDVDTTIKKFVSSITGCQ
jgi:tryptophan synthase, alpha subunit